jgi:membrane-associated phospholipid phosphatase
MSIDGDLKKSRYSAAGFVALLALSVFWPSPVVSSNRLWFHTPLDVDELSFLGREAPSWDVVYWCLAGLFLLMVIGTSSGIGAGRLRAYRALQISLPRRFPIAVVSAAAIVAAVWVFADGPALAVAEGIQSDVTESFVRILNRLGGGMNPPMIVVFFLVAGLAYHRGRWVNYAVAMAMAGLSAGLFAQLLKFVFGRTRPELWLGPFHYARGGANSFPSGHTVGAFALAGVLIFSSRSLPLRVVALLLAAAVGCARIMAFRHWPSDVVASALIGLLAAAIASASVSNVTLAAPDRNYAAPRTNDSVIGTGRV